MIPIIKITEIKEKISRALFVPKNTNVFRAMYVKTPRIKDITTTIPPLDATFFECPNLFISSHKSPTSLHFLIQIGKARIVKTKLTTTAVKSK